MPNEQRHSQRAAGIARSRLDPNLLERSFAQNLSVTDAVEGWLPAAVAASVAMLAVLLWRMPNDGSSPSVRSTEPVPPAEVVELLSTVDSEDVASEDPEFYAWLASHGLRERNGAG